MLHIVVGMRGIDMALNTETQWMGRASTTLEETIEQLEEAAVAEEYESGVSVEATVCRGKGLVQR